MTWLPTDMPDPQPVPVAPSSSSDSGIDLGFSPRDVGEDIGKGVIGFFVAVGALFGAANAATHPTVGAPP